jgi:hypothetical protein
LRAQLALAEARRDQATVIAARDGWGQLSLAEAAELTKGRIGQIVSAA